MNISGTAYVPMQSPQVLQEMFGRVIETAQAHQEPRWKRRSSLWVHLAYLQPFEDGNKRVSRLAANVPLMLYNHAPLSFLHVEREDYALAMMGIYEFRDVSRPWDLFAWTYRRSQAKYRVILESMGAPGPVSHPQSRGLERGRAEGRAVIASLRRGRPRWPGCGAGRWMEQVSALLGAVS